MGRTTGILRRTAGMLDGITGMLWGRWPFVSPTAPRSSRTKNMMWYGVLGTKELLQRTYKNLEQRVQLEVRGQGWERGWGGGQQGGPQAQPSLAVRRGTHLAAQPAGHRRAQHPQLRRGHQFLGWHQGGQRECELRVWGGGRTPLYHWGGGTEPSVGGGPFPRRTSARRPLMTRSWRWWLCSAASRWPCHGSSTCSTTALPR